jgi:HAD superfamily hydrolase (TIGR01662 family)
MQLYFPDVGWLVRLDEEPDLDKLEELQSAPGPLPMWWNEAWIDPEGHLLPYLFLDNGYDCSELVGKPGIQEARPVWWLNRSELGEFDDEGLKGRRFSQCMGSGWVYDTREEALLDLSKCSEPMAWLCALALGKDERLGGLARAALAPDLATLAILADALEDAGHPRAEQVRQLSNANLPPDVPPPPAAPEPRAKKGKRGTKSRKASASEPAAPAVVSTPATPVRRTTGQEVVLIGGYPAGGKSTMALALVEQGYERLNRDELGGKLDDLLPRLDTLLGEGASVVLDNLFATRKSRVPFVESARAQGVPIRFLLLDTTLEDAQFNACLRMIDRCGRVLHPEDHKKKPYKDDPGLYPVAVLYKYRKEFEEPSTDEGFTTVETTPFERRYPAEWTEKAIIFDFDGTLRTHKGKEKFPVKPGEVKAFTERVPKIREYVDQGYLLLGASNQSGIAKGKLTAADCEACFAETTRQLGLVFADIRHCPHSVPPISCYCRKPGPGMGVELIVKHRLDPRRCIYVGDRGTDKSFAERCGFQFIDQSELFGD